MMQRLARVSRENADRLVQRPLSYAEKILLGHLVDYQQGYAKLVPDRVAMQDASAQTAILQFASTGIQTTRVPASIHCDHYIAAQQGHKHDLIHALNDNKQVFTFLQSAAKAFGIDFWKPGAGIIHQTVLENVYLFICVC
jgi:aconitase A